MGILKARKLISFVLLIVVVCVISSFIPPVRPAAVAVLRFPLVVLTALKNEAGGLIFYHRNMTANRRLSAEAELLRRKLVDAQEAHSENARLRELLGLKKDAPYKVICAQVVGRNPSSWSSSIVIDKGASSGIRKGYVCVGFLGLIGRVVEVSASSSKVMLINDPNLCVSAVLARSRQEGLICGSLSGVLLMKYLTSESDIQVADEILTSGLTDVFPKGIMIGTVSRIRQEFSGGNRYAVVRPAVDLGTLEEVLVIIP